MAASMRFRSYLLNQARENLTLHDYGTAFSHYLLAVKIDPNRSDEIHEEFLVCMCQWTELLNSQLHRDELSQAFVQAKAVCCFSDRLMSALGEQALRLEKLSTAVSLIREAKQAFPQSVVVKKTWEHVSYAAVERWHFKMLNDVQRNRAYHDAIVSTIQKNSVSSVLDIGCGTGLLSVFAEKGGAQHITLCDAAPVMTEICSAVLASHRQQTCSTARLRIFDARSTNLSIPEHIPERVDMVVTEIFDAALFGERCLSTLCHAWSHLLHNSPHRKGQVIPRAATLYLCAIECSEIRKDHCMEQTNMPFLDLSNVGILSGTGTADGEPYTTEDLYTIRHSFRYLSPVHALMTVDFNDSQNLESLSSHTQDLLLDIYVEGIVDALAVWFDLDLCDGVKVSTAPSERCCWEQAIFPVTNVKDRGKERGDTGGCGALQVNCGDQLKICSTLKDGCLRLKVQDVVALGYFLHSCHISPRSGSDEERVNRPGGQQSCEELTNSHSCQLSVNIEQVNSHNGQLPDNIPLVSSHTGQPSTNGVRVNGHKGQLSSSREKVSSQSSQLSAAECENDEVCQSSSTTEGVKDHNVFQLCNTTGEVKGDVSDSPNISKEIRGHDVREPWNDAKGMDSVCDQMCCGIQDCGDREGSSAHAHNGQLFSAQPVCSHVLNGQQRNGAFLRSKPQANGELIHHSSWCKGRDRSLHADMARSGKCESRAYPVPLSVPTDHDSSAQDLGTGSSSLCMNVDDDSASTEEPTSRFSQSAHTNSLRLQGNGDNPSGSRVTDCDQGGLPSKAAFSRTFGLQQEEVRHLNDKKFSCLLLSALQHAQTHGSKPEKLITVSNSPPLTGLMALKSGFTETEFCYVGASDDSEVKALMEFVGRCNGVSGRQWRWCGGLVEDAVEERLSGGGVDMVYVDVVEMSGCLRAGLSNELRALRSLVSQDVVMVPQAIDVYAVLIDSQQLQSMSCVTSDDNTMGVGIAQHINPFQTQTFLDLDVHALPHENLSDVIHVFHLDIQSCVTSATPCGGSAPVRTGSEVTCSRDPDTLETSSSGGEPSCGCFSSPRDPVDSVFSQCKQLCVTARRSGQATAVVFWFDQRLAPGVNASTVDPHMNWKQAAFLLNGPRVSEGQEVVISAHLENAYLHFRVGQEWNEKLRIGTAGKKISG